jgi:hypothetical protein
MPGLGERGGKHSAEKHLVEVEEGTDTDYRREPSMPGTGAQDLEAAGHR